jgi:hypothetical protein
MTPQENAKELVNAMGISVSYGTNYTGGDDIPMYRNQYAKECALIAVDEIIKVAYWQSVKDYWKEVKQEIEKL